MNLLLLLLFLIKLIGLSYDCMWNCLSEVTLFQAKASGKTPAEFRKIGDEIGVSFDNLLVFISFLVLSLVIMKF